MTCGQLPRRAEQQDSQSPAQQDSHGPISRTLRVRSAGPSESCTSKEPLRIDRGIDTRRTSPPCPTTGAAATCGQPMINASANTPTAQRMTRDQYAEAPHGIHNTRPTISTVTTRRAKLWTQHWANLRADWLIEIALRATAGDPIHCRRCHHPVLPGQRIDIGHIIDRTNGGPATRANTRPEHQHCNRSAGRAAAHREARPLALAPIAP